MTLLPGASVVEANPGWSCDRIKPKNKGSLTLRHQRGRLLQASNKDPPDLLVKGNIEKKDQIQFHLIFGVKIVQSSQRGRKDHYRLGAKTSFIEVATKSRIRFHKLSSLTSVRRALMFLPPFPITAPAF